MREFRTKTFDKVHLFYGTKFVYLHPNSSLTSFSLSKLYEWTFLSRYLNDSFPSIHPRSICFENNFLHKQPVYFFYNNITATTCFVSFLHRTREYSSDSSLNKKNRIKKQWNKHIHMKDTREIAKKRINDATLSVYSRIAQRTEVSFRESLK